MADHVVLPCNCRPFEQEDSPPSLTDSRPILAAHRQYWTLRLPWKRWARVNTPAGSASRVLDPHDDQIDATFFGKPQDARDWKVKSRHKLRFRMSSLLPRVLKRAAPPTLALPMHCPWPKRTRPISSSYG